MTTVVRAGRFIDGNSGDPQRNVNIHIDGQTITKIGGDLPRDATVIDCSEQTVMPGMIDCHVHLMSTPASIEERLGKPYSLVVAEAFTNAKTTLEAGFTTVRDAGGTPLGVKRAVEQGLFPGPRMRIAVGALSQTAGHGDLRMASGANLRADDPEHPWTVVDGPDNVRKVTRELIRAGADQIKICTSGGVLSPSDEPTATGFTPDEIKAVVYEAHAAGKTVMSHAQALQGIKNAVEAGVESIEHGIYLDEETAELMKKKGTFLVATLVAPLWVKRRAERKPGSMPAYAVRKAEEVLETHQKMFTIAVMMGVKIAMGTDTGVGEHGSNAEELEWMVKLGMTPMQALVAVTKTAAECARLSKITGSLEAGKRADLIAIAGDPLAGIGILQDATSITLVMRDGQVFKQLSA
jgi:imidazolonepropionase-like amidohydrolase